MGSKLSVAWLLFLALKVSGLKEDDSIVLQCYQSVPSNAMNCSWFTQDPPDVDAIHVLHYQSLKFHPHHIHSMRSWSKQNWLIIERRKLTHGDDYSVWVEVCSAAGNITSKKLNFSLNDIVKPPPPILDPVELDASGALVTWKNPVWSASVGHHPLICALRYKASTDHDWTYLHEESVGQEGHELEDLKPFTYYEVEARCIPEEANGFWSEWSPPQTFRTPEAAPVGQVDVWREVVVSENGERSFLLLWKALDPEVAQGDILDYDVTYQNYGKKIYKRVYHCCNATLPYTAQYAWITARNSIKKTLPVNLSLVQTERPGPEEVQVLAVSGLGFNVTWKPSTSPQWVPLEEYVVEWREDLLGSKGEPLNWIRRPSSSDSALLRGDFRPKIPYSVRVSALYAEGSSTSVPVRAYFQEEAPSASPQALQDKSISSTVSHISWKEIPLESRNGHITHYTLYLKDSSSGNFISISTDGLWTGTSPRTTTLSSTESISGFGATETSYKFSDLKPGTAYQLWMTGSTIAGEGVSSPEHHFSTPAVSHWLTIVIVSLVVAVLFILAAVMVYAKHRWVLGFCHKILPPWCWERIPDPGHSIVTSEINAQNTTCSMDTLCQYLDQSPERMDIVDIKEPPPQPLPPPSSTPVVNSGYEKHFMPTQEEMQKLT